MPTATKQEVTFRLPFPPSVNHYWKHRWVPGKGRSIRSGFIQTYISKEGQQFRGDVVRIVRGRFGRLRPIRDRLEVVVRLHPPNRIRRDLDNFGGKAVLDSLTHAGVWADDKQIDRLVIERGSVVDAGYADITIRVIPEPQTELFGDEPEQEELPW